ncbi:hypothetical protein, partial [Rhodococcus sp. BS-15]|uniref:hypothetical protein n=1 Tax=Rhodococcus sp. BS-15 TaxID=1304954 RepID=UPI001F39F312
MNIEPVQVRVLRHRYRRRPRWNRFGPSRFGPSGTRATCAICAICATAITRATCIGSARLLLLALSFLLPFASFLLCLLMSFS